MPPELIIDLAQIDMTKIVDGPDAIRRVNPQRFEMEHLDAIVYFDPHLQIIVGYKDVRPDEFWVRGHMPGYPLLPGVIMCEAAAQLCSFYIKKSGIVKDELIGFGGMENVRFRSPVRPGDRLVLVSKGIKVRPRHSSFNVQAFVGDTMVFHGDIIGVAIPRKEGV